MSAPSATADDATPVSAARKRVGGNTRPTIAAIDTPALTKNNGPSQRTLCSTTAYCWMWTAASPASATAPITYAATTSAPNAMADGAADSWLPGPRSDIRDGVLVAIAAPAR